MRVVVVFVVVEGLRASAVLVVLVVDANWEKHRDDLTVVVRADINSEDDGNNADVGINKSFLEPFESVRKEGSIPLRNQTRREREKTEKKTEEERGGGVNK